MNKILSDLITIIKAALSEHLPDVEPKDLEEEGKVYYMNGKNGTEFDWFVNEHLPSFMVFYDNEEKLGAVKMDVYDAGDIVLYLFDDGGKNLHKEIPLVLDATREELLALAVILRNNADKQRIWDADVEAITTDVNPTPGEIQEFLDDRKYCEPSINRKKLMSKFALVSKRIIEDGWKVGYMKRTETTDERDSGWEFYSGNEEDAFLDGEGNCLWYPVHVIVGIDPLLMDYIETPAKVSFVRVSPEQFEKDQGQEIWFERWKEDKKD